MFAMDTEYGYKKIKFTELDNGEIRVETWLDWIKVHNVRLTSETAEKLADFINNEGVYCPCVEDMDQGEKNF